MHKRKINTTRIDVESRPLIRNSPLEHAVAERKRTRTTLLLTIFNLKTFLLFLATIAALAHIITIFYGLIANNANLPAIGLTIIQPISLLVFSFIHGWLTLGVLHTTSFAFISILISFLSTYITSSTGLPFGKLSYNKEEYGTASFVGHVPFDVPLFDYTLTYLCFSVAEITIFGSKRTRYEEEIGVRVDPLHSFLVLPMITALGMVSFDLCMQPIAQDSNLWSYDVRVPVYVNDTIVSHKNPGSIFEGDLYHGAPIYALVGVAVVSFITVVIYLCIEYVLDRMLIELDYNYGSLKGKRCPSFINALFRRLSPPLYGSYPTRYVSDAFIMYMCMILPLLCMIMMSIMYALLATPPYIRVIAIVTLILPMILPLSRMSSS
jgi:uncharacterized membrane protein